MNYDQDIRQFQLILNSLESLFKQIQNEELPIPLDGEPQIEHLRAALKLRRLVEDSIEKIKVMQEEESDL